MTNLHQSAVQHATDAVSKPEVNAYEVGWLFVQEYYTFLNKDPQKLHCFYNAKSSFIHGTECESLDTQSGQKEIQQRIAELDFHDCKVLVSNVDSQSSHNGCIAIMVLGEMSNKGGASHKFCQCFVLAEQPSGYFVFNDMFRFLKEDIDNEYEEAADPMYENDYLNNISNATATNNHSSHLNDIQSIPAPVVPVVAQPISPNPVTAAPRGRSPSPKKQPTPTPVAAPLRARSPSPKKDTIPAVVAAVQKQPSPVPATSTFTEKAAAIPSTPAKTDDNFVGSWAESVPTPAPAAVVAPSTAAASSNSAPSSPTKASQQKKKNATTGKTEAAASSVPPVAAPAATPAAPAKPKSWAAMASATATDSAPSVAAAAAKQPLAAKPSAESIKRPPSSQGKVAPTAVQQAPLVKKVAIAHAAPAASNEENGVSGGEFREVQRGRAGNNNNVNNNRNGQKTFIPKSEDAYPRSIFFMLPEGVDEAMIREYFTKNNGPIVDVTIVRGKPLVFVEFEDVAVAQAAIGKPVVINGKTITPEPRKPKSAIPSSGASSNNGSLNGGYHRPQQRYSGQNQGQQGRPNTGASNNQGRPQGNQTGVKGGAAVAAV
ncbi:hypothetical protein HDU79_003054 [Rhizoclosmatium sp. JEL0117]|nr:hypothetical protein HDU79_003054 [Rhizoclosmatium sp. JEL0117]